MILNPNNCPNLGIGYGALDTAKTDLPGTCARLAEAFNTLAQELRQRHKRPVRVAVYGASESGRVAWGFLRAAEGIEVTGFLDAHSLSDDIAGLPCVAPAQAHELSALDAIVVAVAPRHLPEVLATLAEHDTGAEVISIYQPEATAQAQTSPHGDAAQRFAAHEHSRRLREHLKQERDTRLEPNERPAEYAFVFNWLTKLYPDNILDVGAGSTSLPHLMQLCGFSVTAIDLDPLANRHFYLEKANIAQDDLGRRFNAITCISTLEHIERHVEAMANMFRHQHPGGALLLTVPFHETRYVANIHAQAGTNRPCDMGITQIFSRREVDAWLAAHDWELAGEELYAHFTGELFTLGEEFYPMRRLERGAGKVDLACLALRRRA